MSEVAALRPVAEDRGCRAVERVLDEERDDRGIWGIRILTRTEDVEVAERRHAQATVAASVRESDLLAEELGVAIG